MAINLNIEGLQSAESGMIYEFIEKDGEIKNKFLVIQNEKRAENNLVSGMMLGTRKGASDTIPIKLDGTMYYVHCGMMTYCKRKFLGKKIGNIQKETMSRIKKSVAFQLGLSDDDNNYKEMYEQLLNKVMEKW